MSNTNMDALYPEFWAQAFEEIHSGKYTLQNQVSRKFESVLGQMGDTVNVPIVPSSTASDYDGGEVTTVDGITQSTVPVILDKSKKANFELTGKDYSLSPYDLISTYGVSKAEAIVKAVNNDIYLAMLGGTNFATPLTASSFSEDYVIDIKDGLDSKGVDDINRIMVCSTSAMNRLLKADAFQYVNYSGTDEAMKKGIINEKFGFEFVPCTSISKYTPADVAGAVNKVGGYAAGATTMIVDGFNDDVNPIRVGDIFHIASGTNYYTVTSTKTTTSDTTEITFSPALVETTVADDAVINIDASESAIGMHKSAVALASRGYGVLPQGLGVRSAIIDYKGLPIRISVWASGLVVKVQYDILYGVKLVHNDRLYRLPLK